MALRTAITVALFLATTGAARAQMPMRPMTGFRFVQTTTVHGKIDNIGPGMIAITNHVQEKWMLRLSEESRLRITGTAEPDMLRKDSYVRFVATVDRRQNKVVEKVSKLTIFAPAKDDLRTPGVYLPGQCKDEDEAQVQPAVPPNVPPQPGNPPGGHIKPAKPGGPASPAAVKPGLEPLFPGAKPRLVPSTVAPGAAAPDDANQPGAAKDKADAPPAAPPEQLDIHAQIVAAKGNWLTLSFPPNPFLRSPLRIELADKLEIDVDLVDYSMAKRGDHVKATGIPADPKLRLLEVMRLTIALSDTLGTPRKKIAKAPAKHPGARAKPGEDAEQPPVVAEAPPRTVPPKPAGADPPGPAAKPPESDPAAKPGPAEPPLQGDDLSSRIVAALQLKPEEAQAKGTVTLSLGGAGAGVFLPTRAESAEKIAERFGAPASVQSLKLTLRAGENAKGQEVQWQLWTYGPLKLFVDENWTTRYYQLDKK